MGNEKKLDGKNPDGAGNSASGLYVPLPAMLMSLGILASASHAEAVPLVQANNDNYSMHQNGVLSGVNILANDSCPNCHPVIAGGLTSHGDAIVDSGGNLTYTPNTGFAGIDSFNYCISSPFGNSCAQVSIQVNAASSIPTLQPVALGGLAGLLAFYGLRRRKHD